MAHTRSVCILGGRKCWVFGKFCIHAKLVIPFSGFDLTRFKWFVSFHEHNCKTNLNVSHHSSATKKLFHSQSPKTILNGISFAFLCYWKTSDLHLIVELYIILLKNHVRNHLKITFVEFCIHAGKDHQCFCRSFRNQTFTFISSKVVYFKKSRTNQV